MLTSLELHDLREIPRFSLEVLTLNGDIEGTNNVNKPLSVASLHGDGIWTVLKIGMIMWRYTVDIHCVVVDPCYHYSTCECLFAEKGAFPLLASLANLSSIIIIPQNYILYTHLQTLCLYCSVHVHTLWKSGSFSYVCFKVIYYTSPFVLCLKSFFRRD